MAAFVDDFDGPELDTVVWLPHYLPMWSSREATLASYRLEELVPRARHPARPRAVAARGPPSAAPALRSPERKPVRPGGQHRRAAGRVRRAAGPGGATRLHRPSAGRWAPRDPLPDDDLAAVDGGALAVRLRGAARPLWGDLRDRGLRQGRRPRASPPRSASGSSRSATPTSPQDFAAPRLPIDVAEFHTYAVDWDATEAVFSVDGEKVRTLPRAADLSPAGDGRGLRLPGLEHGRRRPARARARRRQDQRRLSVTPRGSAGRSAPRRTGCRCASR